MFANARFLFFLGTQRDYISQCSVQLRGPILLCSSQWKEERGDVSHSYLPSNFTSDSSHCFLPHRPTKSKELMEAYEALEKPLDQGFLTYFGAMDPFGCLVSLSPRATGTKLSACVPPFSPLLTHIALSHDQEIKFFLSH